MFACPSCRGKTIGLWARMRANVFRPVRCPSCGGLLIVSRRAVLGALGVAELAAVPLLVAGPTVPLMTFASLLALLGLSGCVYSFGFAPMEQLAHAEPEPRWRATTYVLVAMALVGLLLIPTYAIFRL
jgi:hypothetical protein